MVVMALPGAMYLYQGDELGLPEVPDIPEDRLQDPIARRMRGQEKGRDGCRVPLPWTATGRSFGFGPDDGAEPHLPQPAGWGEHAVELEEADPGSMLHLYREGLRLRREIWGAAHPSPGRFGGCDVTRTFWPSPVATCSAGQPSVPIPSCRPGRSCWSRPRSASSSPMVVPERPVAPRVSCPPTRLPGSASPADPH